MPSDIDLCTRDDVRLALEVEATARGRDELIDELVTDASQRVIDHCAREFAPKTDDATRTFPVDISQGGRGGWVVDLNPYDLRTATTVTLHPGTAAAAVLTAGAGYTLEPVPSRWGTYYLLRLSVFLSFSSDFTSRFGYATISVQGAWGFADIPETVKRATVETVCSWMDKAVTSYGGPEDQAGRLILPDPIGGLDIPASAKRKLEQFARLEP